MSIQEHDTMMDIEEVEETIPPYDTLLDCVPCIQVKDFGLGIGEITADEIKENVIAARTFLKTHLADKEPPCIPSVQVAQTLLHKLYCANFACTKEEVNPYTDPDWCQLLEKWLPHLPDGDKKKYLKLFLEGENYDHIALTDHSFDNDLQEKVSVFVYTPMASKPNEDDLEYLHQNNITICEGDAGYFDDEPRYTLRDNIPWFRSRMARYPKEKALLVRNSLLNETFVLDENGNRRENLMGKMHPLYLVNRGLYRFCQMKHYKGEAHERPDPTNLAYDVYLATFSHPDLDPRDPKWVEILQLWLEYNIYFPPMIRHLLQLVVQGKDYTHVFQSNESNHPDYQKYVFAITNRLVDANSRDWDKFVCHPLLVPLEDPEAVHDYLFKDKTYGLLQIFDANASLFTSRDNGKQQKTYLPLKGIPDLEELRTSFMETLNTTPKK